MKKTKIKTDVIVEINIETKTVKTHKIILTRSALMKNLAEGGLEIPKHAYIYTILPWSDWSEGRLDIDDDSSLYIEWTTEETKTSKE